MKWMYKNIVSVKINCYKGFDYNQTFSGIKNSGFKYVELSVSKGNSANLSYDLNNEELNSIKNDLSDRGIIPICIGGNSFLMDNDTSKILKNIELAKLFNCKYVDTTIFNARSDKGILKSDKEIADRIKFFVPYLEKNDLDLVIELHGEYATGAKLSKILDLVNSNHVHINYDTGNALYWGKLSPNEMLNDLNNCIDKISYMHIKDKLGEYDDWNFPAIGKGYVPFDEIFKLLNDSITLCVEIEFTQNGISDIKEVDDALLFSSNYLKSKGFVL